MNENRISRELTEFLNASPTGFHAVDQIEKKLSQNGFLYLKENAHWALQGGGRYYTKRNDSSLIAFSIGNAPDAHFQITAAHSDSPSFKLKHLPLLENQEYLRLNVEGYGGMISYSWMDRPLGLAGRIYVEGERGVEKRLFAPDRDLCIIPSISIHYNREVNKGYAFNPQKDLCPLFSAGTLRAEDFKNMLGRELDVDPARILAGDLYLVNRQKALLWGEGEEFISAPRLDDLACAFAALEAFLQVDNPSQINVFALFDNEEVGSMTRQGAMSTFLSDTLQRIDLNSGSDREHYYKMLAGSLLVSCDNAHAKHPNHPDRTDEVNFALLNKGLVIKESANQKYTTDAFSRAVFMRLCTRAGIPFQTFANRSDQAGGSTLGNLSNTQVSIPALDVGLPQLAMHSAYETAGLRDVDYAIRALTEFYRACIVVEDGNAFF